MPLVHTPLAHDAATRVLLVSDWSVDPHRVIASAIRHDQLHPAAFGLLVPAWLHGLDWAGDPNASAPCARRQLESIRDLADNAGLTVSTAAVGDPDPATAILDAVTDWPAEEILLCVGARRLPAGPLDLARRVRRLTRLPVDRVAIRSTQEPRQSGRRHCAPLVSRAGRAV